MGVRTGRRTSLWDKQNLRRAELRKLRRVLVEAGHSTTQLDAVIADGGAAELDSFEIHTLYGFAFQFDHYKRIGAATGRHPSTLQPIDATEAERKAYLKDFQRPRKNAAKRDRDAKRRAAIELAGDLDCRRSAIYFVLDDKWRTVAEIMRAVGRSAAFRTPDGKRFLTGGSLSKAIRRELEHPAFAPMIEIAKRTGKRGLIEKLIRRHRDVS
jgi:hypothetical protein